MGRELKLCTRLDDKERGVCRIWIEEEGSRKSNLVLGLTVEDIESFFIRHPKLMLHSHLVDFVCLLQSGGESVGIADDPAALLELGLVYKNERGSPQVEAA